MDTQSTTEPQVKPVDKEKVKKLWLVAGYLGLITAIEFGFAFGMEAGVVRTVIFILLTLVKAFYIVAEFMHLGHEVRSLMWSIVLPVIFILWLIVALIIQGDALRI